MATYEAGAAGGFVARFEVELLFDRDHPGTGFDLVGVECVCHLCGGRLVSYNGRADLRRCLEEHARTHRPAPVEGPRFPATAPQVAPERR